MDTDTRAVMDRLDQALTSSGLSLRQFAHAVGTSASRFSTYRSGRVAPSAAFLLRVERIASALARAAQARVPTSLDAVASLRRAAQRGDDDWTYAVALEVRDRLRSILSDHTGLAESWEAAPAPVDDRWDTLVAAFVSHEFTQADLPAPGWTQRQRLADEWVLDTPRLSVDEIKAQTPDWLADRNIYVAAKDLATV